MYIRRQIQARNVWKLGCCFVFGQVYVHIHICMYVYIRIFLAMNFWSSWQIQFISVKKIRLLRCTWLLLAWERKIRQRERERERERQKIERKRREREKERETERERNSERETPWDWLKSREGLLQFVAVCCSALQERGFALQETSSCRASVCCSILQYVAVCCSVL